MHAVVIAVAFGLLFTAVMLIAGPALYRSLGGGGAALSYAIAYSTIVFGGAMTVWLCNILASVVRGTGNMAVPAIILSTTALLQIPLCGALVLGWGPFPRLGISGAGIAYVCSFGAGALCFAGYILAGYTGLAVRWRGMQFSARLFADILTVGLLSSFNAVQTIATAVIVTGLVGTFGTAALAGYGLGVRLELLQIPVVFAIGSALVVMVGTCIGAGDVKRARHIAWSGAGLAACVTGSVGVTVALWPGLWAGMFSSDPAVLDAGYTYLRIAGGCYAFLGAGIALYFASQGAGRMFWPVLAGSARFVIAVIGGLIVLRYFNGTLAGLFAVIGFAMFVYGAGDRGGRQVGRMEIAGRCRIKFFLLPFCFGAASRRFRSLDPDIRGLDHLAPLDDFIADELSELRGRRRRCGLGAVSEKPLAHVLAGNHRHDVGADLFDDRVRRACRHLHAGPRDRAVAGHARLRDRRQAGQRCASPLAAHSQRVQPAASNVRHDGEHAAENKLDLAGDHIGDGGPHAFVRNMHGLRVRHDLEQFRREMRTAAGPRRAEIERFRMRAGKRDKFLHVARGHFRVRDQHVRLKCEERHRREILEHVIRERRPGGGIDDETRRRYKQRVAVRRGLRRQLRADDGPAAGAVIDDDLLPPHFRQLLRDHARHDVGAAACRVRHDDARVPFSRDIAGR